VTAGAPLDPVDRRETLVHLLFNPVDWDGSGMTPRALTTQDLTDRNRGWSVQRHECSAKEHYQQIVDRRRRSNPLLKLERLAEVSAAALYDLRVDDAPAVDVVPDPLSTNEAHALVFATPGLKGSKVKELKAEIIKRVMLKASPF